ncbi:MAG: hypothetical protein ACLGHF_00825 [Alphaproteobacteria bacterium]
MTSTSAAFDGPAAPLSFAATLDHSGETDGNYAKVEVDAKGRVISLASADVAGVSGHTLPNNAGDSHTG